MFTSTTLSK